MGRETVLPGPQFFDGGAETDMAVALCAMGRRTLVGALAARQFLINQGIAAERISTESFGYSRPTATNGTEWGRARNRRNEFKWAR